MSVKILEIFKKHNFIVDESVLWSILSSGVIFIQKKISLKDYELCLMTLECMNLKESGRFFVKRDLSSQISRSYVMPEIIDLKEEWHKGDDKFKESTLLYSLGISLRFCKIIGKNRLLGSVLDQITDRNAAKRLTLLEVLKICTAEGKEVTKGRTYHHILSTFYSSYQSQIKIVDDHKMIRSVSHNNVLNRRPSTDYTRQLSLGNMEILQPLQGDLRGSNESHNDSGLDIQSNSNGMSSPSSKGSDNNINKGLLTTSNYENLMLNAIDNRPNVTEAFERVKKARRNFTKTNGPMKSPANVTLSQSFDQSGSDFPENQNNGFLSQSYGSKPGTIFKEPLEISTIERFGGFRHVLGPEFIIRMNETFNVTYNQQKRNSIFSRTDSGRLIRSEVMVHLLNGVVLLIRGLNNKSTTSQIINAILHAMPDLEFVTFGLCFELDSEFFFLKEDVNVYKLINYISNKTNHLKVDNKTDSNGGLHLYYRLKYYPTLTSVKEMSPSNHRLLYLQLRQDLLNRNLPPLTVLDAISLAGAAIQTEFGNNCDNLKEDLEYLKIEYYFHRSFINIIKVNEKEIDFLKKEQSKWLSLKWSESEAVFIEKVLSNKYYGFHWYRVNKNQLSIMGAIGKESFIALDRYCIQLIDINRTNAEVQIYRHFHYKWKQIDSITIKQKKIIIKPKMHLKVEGVNANNVFVCYLDSKTKAEYIVRLCNDHHLIASQDDDNDTVLRRETCNDTGSHLRLSTIDYPMSLKASVDFYDEDIFIDYASSGDNNDDVCDSSRPTMDNETMSTKYRLDCMRSLENMTKDSLTSNNGSKSDNLAVNCNFNFEQEDLECSRQGSNTDGDFTKSGESGLSNVVIKTKKPLKSTDNSSMKMFEVDIHRLADENIGIGILNVNIPDCQGIFIKCFVANSAAAKCDQLKVGDEIISINNQPVSFMTQDEVSKIMINCGNDITLLIRRHNLEDLKMAALKPLSVDSKEVPEPERFKNTNGKYNKTEPKCTKLKTNDTVRSLLSTNGALANLRTNYRRIVIPPVNLDKQNQISKRKIDTLVTKEVKGFEEKLRWHLKSKLFVNGSTNEIYDVTVCLNGLVCQKVSPSIDISFQMICIQQEDQSRELFWKMVHTNNTSLVVTLVSKSMNRSLLQSEDKSDSRYKVAIVEKSDLSDTITVRRVSIGGSKRRVFQIQFCEWYNKRTSADILLQITNLACLLHQNIPNNGNVVIAFEDPSCKPTDFVVMFITVLLNLHCEFLFHPVLGNQTLVHAIYSQIIDQSKELLPTETQYRSCIEVLKLLLPYGDPCDQSSSEISDVE